MKIQFTSLEILDHQVSNIIQKAQELELIYSDELSGVHPIYQKSAQNMVHYLAFRSFDIDIMQDKLRELGLPSLTNIEGHVLEPAVYKNIN